MSEQPKTPSESFGPEFERQSRIINGLSASGVSICKAQWSRERVSRVEMSWEVFEIMLEGLGVNRLVDELDAREATRQNPPSQQADA